MTKEELAAQLNGREMGEEITEAEEQAAKESGLVVIFGYSDDNVELRGVVHDEVSACEGTELFLHRGGLLELPNEDCPVCVARSREQEKKCAKVESVWDGGSGYLWTYKTEIPHAGFDVLENEEKFCRGIVIEVSALPPL